MHDLARLLSSSGYLGWEETPVAEPERLVESYQECSLCQLCNDYGNKVSDYRRQIEGTYDSMVLTARMLECRHELRQISLESASVE